MRGGEPAITFRGLCEADLPLLCEWLNRPHVKAWWAGNDGEADIESTRQTYLSRANGSSNVKAYIVLLGDEPVGFIQSYVAFGCGEGWWEEETDPGVVGIDQFLCDPHRLGQGLGSRMVKAFVDLLLDQPGVTKIQTDPHPSNVRAIRCYERVGFRRVREIETPDGPALLMAMEKRKAGALTTGA